MRQATPPVNEQRPLPYPAAAAGEALCAVSTASLLLQRRIRLPRENVGMRLRFADGTLGQVYRETVVEGAGSEEVCVLIVKFRLRLVRGRWHQAFRWESLLNTPLFVGFPGFVSKLWLAHDANDVYRGVYEWDGSQRAEHYARSLWRVLALGCEPDSIAYRVLPGLHRDELIAHPGLVDETQPDAASAWWRIVAAP